jgi:hypothetical protein
VSCRLKFQHVAKTENPHGRRVLSARRIATWICSLPFLPPTSDLGLAPYTLPLGKRCRQSTSPCRTSRPTNRGRRIPARFGAMPEQPIGKRMAGDSSVNSQLTRGLPASPASRFRRRRSASFRTFGHDHPPSPSPRGGHADAFPLIGTAIRHVGGRRLRRDDPPDPSVTGPEKRLLKQDS